VAVKQLTNTLGKRPLVWRRWGLKGPSNRRRRDTIFRVRRRIFFAVGHRVVKPMQLSTPDLRSSMELSHGQRHQSDPPRPDSSQRGNIEPPFRYRLCDRSCGRNDRLGFSVRLAHRQGSEVAAALAQIFRYSAADHNPECKIHFQRDPHRASPHFDSGDSSTPYSGVSAGGQSGRFKVVHCVDF
jgi:hypothetical protein